MRGKLRYVFIFWFCMSVGVYTEFRGLFSKIKNNPSQSIYSLYGNVWAEQFCFFVEATT